jgi:aspartyl-tRNA(Asn)/glutamyl-tRNA(Gln) amidotransferase subunit A
MTQSWTATALRDAVRSRSRSARDVCRDALDRAAALNASLNAFNTLAGELALARADAIDNDLDLWRDTPLVGVPIAVKDNICTRGLRTTASSRMLETYLPPYDATVVSRLEAAGAIVIGKTNCDEFAMGSSNENSAFGPARNPWSLDRVPGGSSGGSAAAVAARIAPIALGSDTGGSIRQPAAMCGIVGLKPTYGRVSRYGLIAFGSSLDQIGPIATRVRDAAILLRAIAGRDPCDATSAPDAVPDLEASLTGDVRATRIGVPRRMLEQGVDEGIARAFFAALDRLRACGAAVIDIDLPHARHAIPTYYLVATAEASSNLARYDGVRYGFRGSGGTLQEMYATTRAAGFGPEVKRRIMLGTYVLSAGYYDAYYLKAQRVRTLILRDYEEAFGGTSAVDAVAMPTSPVPAFRIGERVADPLQMYLADVFTVSANLAGLPAISVPCGFTFPAGGSSEVPPADAEAKTPPLPPAAAAAGAAPSRPRLPVGLQLTGRRFDESTLLRIADAYERDSEWSSRLPPTSA